MSSFSFSLNNLHQHRHSPSSGYLLASVPNTSVPLLKSRSSRYMDPPVCVSDSMLSDSSLASLLPPASLSKPHQLPFSTGSFWPSQNGLLKKNSSLGPQLQTRIPSYLTCFSPRCLASINKANVYIHIYTYIVYIYINLKVTIAYEKFPLSLSMTHEPATWGTDSQHLDCPGTGFPSDKQPCKNKHTQEL